MRVSTSYQQFGSDGSSPPKRMGHQSLPRHSGGRLRGTNRHSWNLSVGPARASKPTADGLSGSPETWPAINRPPQPEKHTPVPRGKGTQKKINQKQEQESRKGRRGLTGSRRENGERCLMHQENRTCLRTTVVFRWESLGAPKVSRRAWSLCGRI